MATTLFWLRAALPVVYWSRSDGRFKVIHVIVFGNEDHEVRGWYSMLRPHHTHNCRIFHILFGESATYMYISSWILVRHHLRYSLGQLFLLLGHPFEERDPTVPGYHYSWVFTFTVSPGDFVDSNLISATLYIRFANHQVSPRNMSLTSTVMLLGNEARNDDMATIQNMTSHELPRFTVGSGGQTCFTVDLTKPVGDYLDRFGQSLTMSVRITKTCEEPINTHCIQSLPDSPFFIMGLHSRQDRCRFPSRSSTSQGYR